MEASDYEWLLDGLDESREQLRAMKVFGEKRNMQLAWAFYRVEGAAAAIRVLLAQIEQIQPQGATTGERRQAHLN